MYEGLSKFMTICSLKWKFFRYLQERKQFGVPLASYQINQEKLARMLGNIQAMSLMGWRLCKLYEAGKMTPGQASLGKVGMIILILHICRYRSPDGLDFVLLSKVRYDIWTKLEKFYAVIFYF